MFWLLFFPCVLFAQTICLNMIVKDEKDVIERCLQSVKGVIDYWVIVDTGSTDGTQEIIQNYLKEIPGELHERTWENFAHNRNQALELAKGKGDYILIMDADDQCEIDQKPHLEHDFYYILSHSNGTDYYRIQLIRNNIQWEWVGVLHETLQSYDAKTFSVLPQAKMIISYDGHRSKDPQKYEKDAVLLENVLQQEPNNSRYVFYLAQSYRDANNLPKALENYRKRVQMGGSILEIFMCLFEIAKLQERLHLHEELVIQGYLNAYNCIPNRAEPLYFLARHYRWNKKPFLGYLVAKEGVSKTYPQNEISFIEKWIYDYALQQELALCLYEMGHIHEAKEQLIDLLNKKNLPNDIRLEIQNMLSYFIYGKHLER